MGYNIGDILVSTDDTAGGRQKGDIIKMVDENGAYHYGPKDTRSSFASKALPSSVRSATAEEIQAYKKGIRNIEDIKPEIVNQYSIY